ncbi:MAG: ABC transporter permease [Planctomycetes bacterium]|nr:ABC transporter permease [Planctomycetota bacterium]
MLNYILRRLLLMIPTLLGVTAVVFFIMALSPGGVGGQALSEGGEMQAKERQAMREYYRKRYGLDQPLLVQYGRWLNRVSPIGYRYDGDGKSTGFGFKPLDLGESMSKRRPVTDLYMEALPVTLLLNLVTTPIIYVLSILIGVYAARHRNSLFDVGSSTTMLGLNSIPENWAGIMLIGFFASTQFWHWFPAGGLHDTLADQMAFLPRVGSAGFERGWLLDMLWHLALPLLVYTYGGFAFLSKLTRGSVLDSLNADYVRTARAKGVDERTLLFRHVFRNSLLPLITVAAGIIPGLLGGSVIIESIFSIPGMGKLAIDAVFSRDRELVLAGALVAGVIGLLSRLVSDIWYAVADPRVSYE